MQKLARLLQQQNPRATMTGPSSSFSRCPRALPAGVPRTAVNREPATVTTATTSTKLAPTNKAVPLRQFIPQRPHLQIQCQMRACSIVFLSSLKMTPARQFAVGVGTTLIAGSWASLPSTSATKNSAKKGNPQMKNQMRAT